MTFQEYRNYDALGLAQLVRDKEVKPSELLQIAQERCAAVNPILNAVVSDQFAYASEMASALKGDEQFCGVPFLIKEICLYVKGFPRRSGSRALQKLVADTDSWTVTKLRKAGFLFAGTTNVPELGYTPYTESKLFGPCMNPWNMAYTPGGSSGGSAAAVAAGIVPMATASDGGGSIRIPASNCGLVGLKPSRGFSSFGPQHNELWSGAVVDGCLSRSVRDTAAYLDVIRSSKFFDENYLDVLQKAPRKLRIGFSTSHTLGLTTDPDCIAAVKDAAALMETLGHTVEEVPLPFEKNDLLEIFFMMVVGEMGGDKKEMEAELGRKLSLKDLEPNTWIGAKLGNVFSAEAFATAKRKWGNIARRMELFHEKYDVLITPVIATPPAEIGALANSVAEDMLIKVLGSLGLARLAKPFARTLAEQMFQYIPFTPIANMTGQPAISLPLYQGKNNLPIGTMFTSRFGEEDLLIELAGAAEAARPWFNNVPQLHVANV